MVIRTSLAFRPAVLPESPVLPGLKSSRALPVLPNRLGISRAPSMAMSPPPQAVRRKGRARAEIRRHFMQGNPDDVSRHSLAAKQRGERESGHESATRNQTGWPQRRVSEEDLQTCHHTFVKISIVRVWGVQISVQVTVTGEHFCVADNPVAAAQFYAGHVVGITERQNARGVVQGAGEGQARHIRNVQGSKAAQAHSAAVYLVVIPGDAAQTNASGGRQVAKGGAALGVEVHVADVAAAFVIGVASAQLQFVLGAEEVYLALNGIVGQAQVQVAGEYRSGSQGQSEGRDAGNLHDDTFVAFILIRKEWRSEEHTSELQSRPHLVCRLLLEKKKYLLRPGPARTNSTLSPFTSVTPGRARPRKPPTLTTAISPSPTRYRPTTA